MPNTVGQLSVLLDAIIQPFVSKMNEANKVTDETVGAIEKTTGGVSSGFIAATGAVGAFVGVLSAQAIGSAVGLISDLATSVVKAGASAETSKVAFTSLLGSVEAAEGMLKDLRNFAATTPFQFNELQDASRKMLAFGFSSQDILPMLRKVGDAVSALGGGSEQINSVTRALGQMQAKGKVSAQEMQQLAEQGIPAWKFLADEIGVSIPKAMKMAEDGSVDAATGINAVLEGMDKRFAGGMEAASKTVAGMWSNIQDQLEQIAVVLGTMVLPAVKDVLQWIGPIVQKASEWLTIQQQLNDLLDAQALKQQGLAATDTTPWLKDLPARTAEFEKLNAAQEQGVEWANQLNKQLGQGLSLTIVGTTKAIAEETEKQKQTRIAAEKEAAAEIKKWRDLEIAQYREMEKVVEAYGKALERITNDAIKQQNRYAEAIARAADEERRRLTHIQQDVQWSGKQGQVLEQVNAQILNQEEAVRRGTDAIEAQQGAWKANRNEATAGLRQQSAVAQEVSTVMTDLNRGLAQAIIQWGGFREVGMRALTEMGEAILRLIIKQFLESTLIVQKLTNAIVDLVNQLLKWLQIQTQLSKVPMPTIPGGGGGTVPTLPGKGGSSVPGGGVAGAAMSGAAGWVTAGASVVSAISDVIGNFQMARQENSLNAIEWNTRKASIHLEYLLEQANKYWPYLEHVNNTLWSGGGGGGVGGGGTQITVNYTGDVRSLAMMLLSELQRMGLRVAPA